MHSFNRKEIKQLLSELDEEKKIRLRLQVLKLFLMLGMCRQVRFSLTCDIKLLRYLDSSESKTTNISERDIPVPFIALQVCVIYIVILGFY